jgi:hypothetical protein
MPPKPILRILENRRERMNGKTANEVDHRSAKHPVLLVSKRFCEWCLTSAPRSLSQDAIRQRKETFERKVGRN